MNEMAPEFIVATEFDFETPCAYLGEDCENSATWNAVVPCCYAAIPMCDEHKHKCEMQVLRTQMLVRRHAVRCWLCNTSTSVQEYNVRWVRR